MKNKVFIIVFALFFVNIFFFSCATIPDATQETSENCLRNGIPVVINENENAKVNTILLYFGKGAANLKQNEEGFYSVLMETLCTESKNYSEKKLKEIATEKLSSITYSVFSECCYITLSCLEKYFYEVLPVFEDVVASPSFSAFEKVKTHRAFELYNTKQIDLNLLLKSSGQVLRAQTNYFGKNSLTKSSLENLDVKCLKVLYNELFAQDEVTLICYGNFEKQKLFAELNKTLGKIPLVKKGEKAVFNFDFVEGVTEFATNEKNAVDFAASYASFPLPHDRLFAASYVASLMYSDILFNVAREEMGSAYSVYASVNLNAHPVLITVGYRISDREKFFVAIKNAKNILAQNKLIEESENGKFKFVDASEKLESYKNILINSLYEGITTGRQIAKNMALGLEIADSTEFMSDLVQKINAISQNDLKEAIKNITQNTEQWFYLTSETEPCAL